MTAIEKRTIESALSIPGAHNDKNRQGQGEKMFPYADFFHYALLSILALQVEASVTLAKSFRCKNGCHSYRCTEMAT